jgi:hypothetical protein
MVMAPSNAAAPPRPAPALRPLYGPAFYSMAVVGTARTLVLMPLAYATLMALLAPLYAPLQAFVAGLALASSQRVAPTSSEVHGLTPGDDRDRGPPAWGISPFITEDDAFFAVALSLSVGLAYGLANGFFFLLDSQHWLQRYKLPRSPHQAPAPGLAAKALAKACVAHCLTGPLIMAFVAGPALRAVGSPVEAELLPAWPAAAKQFFVLCLVQPLLFYWSERALQTKTKNTVSSRVNTTCDIHNTRTTIARNLPSLPRVCPSHLIGLREACARDYRISRLAWWSARCCPCVVLTLPDSPSAPPPAPPPCLSLWVAIVGPPPPSAPGHRLLHTPYLYAAFHKQHHSFVATRSFAAE